MVVPYEVAIWMACPRPFQGTFGFLLTDRAHRIKILVTKQKGGLNVQGFIVFQRRNAGGAVCGSACMV
jgi:hypothetical protein